MHILIAEDERITRMSLVRQLENWGHTMVAAEDGEQALARYRSGSFDIVITDWEMPCLSGLELIQRIRAGAGAGYVYIIMLTSRSDKSDVVRGIEAGADDFVAKPFDREELRVRLLAGVRIVNLERALSKQNAELRDANERIHSGLRAAARIQQSMLPQRHIATEHVRTAWKYVPTEELAGDAVGLHLIDDRYLTAYVIDVSGHGVPAALLAVAAMHAMEPVCGAGSVLRDMSGAGGLGTVQQPARVAAELNRRFRAGENDGRYFTMILAVLDTRTGQLHFTMAGHPCPIVLRGSKVVPVPDAGGMPIALSDTGRYDEGVVQLEPGDRVFLFSDGLLEQTMPSQGEKLGEQFGDQQLLSLLQEHTQSAPEFLVPQVVEALTRWAQRKTFDDDVSVVLLEWVGR
jgi:sigma-B regulation protein RsbU (phosphoserine phosphatase)